MDAYVNIVSLRTIREYSEQSIPRESLGRVLQAGRSAGSSRNTQPWMFHVAHSRQILDRIAETVYAPDNISGCRAAIAISAGKGQFDIGRCAQNMMLAAWAEGIGTAPNGIKDPEAMSAILQLSRDVSVLTVLSMGYPRTAHRPAEDVDGILKRINRKPLEELVTWVD